MVSGERTRRLVVIVDDLEEYATQAGLPKVQEACGEIKALLLPEAIPLAARAGADGDVIPIREAMRLSGKSRNTIKNWVKRGLMGGYQLPTNGETYVERKGFMRLMEMRQVLPDDASPFF